MLPVILICALMVKTAATRNVTVSLGTPKSCFFIGDDVKLLCAVSSESNCCGSTRFWQDNTGTNILTDGTASDASKYEEDYDNGTTGYNLIIKNVQNSDLGLNYKCVYRFKEDMLFLSMDKICNCWKCAGTDYLYSILGDLIGTVIIMIIAKVTGLIGKPKTVLKVGGLTFIISALVNIAFAVLIGYLGCHCVDGKAPLFIVLGLATSGITGGIATYKLKEGSSQGSNGSNVQPSKDNKKKKPAAKQSSNEQLLEEKKKKKSAAGKGSRSPPSTAKHIKTGNNETEMIPTEKGFSGDLEKKRPLPPLTNQPSPTNRPLPLPSSTRPLPSSTRPLPQITTNKGDN